MKEIGAKYRQAREEKNLTIESIAEQTKIQKRFLRAIEEGSWDIIPGEVYLRGFLRTYADILDMDAREILSIYDHQREEEARLEEELIEPPKPKNHLLWGGLIALIILVGALVYIFFLLPS